MEAVILIDASDLRRLATDIDAAIAKAGSMFDSVGARLASSAQERIQSTNVSPEGVAWALWSALYGKTRHAGHSILMDESHLRDSIQHHANPDGTIVGSILNYARTHQEGRGNIPARPYLGVSKKDEDDIGAILYGFINGAFGGAP